MISLQTFADLQRQSYALGLYCMHCDRWGEADLRRLVESGNGARKLVSTRFRCQDCGQVADKQLRPPVPSPGGTIGYIQCSPDIAPVGA